MKRVQSQRIGEIARPRRVPHRKIGPQTGGDPAAVLEAEGRSGHPGHAGMDGAPVAALDGLAAAGVHTIAMLTVMAACALIVYQFVGVSILRTAWFNMDRVWAAVMVGTGALTIALTA